MKDLSLQKNFIKFCESLSFPVVIFRPDMRVISANTIFKEKYQFERENIENRKCHEVLFRSRDGCRDTSCPMDILFAEKRRVSKVKRTIKPNGTDSYEDLNYAPILNDDGEVEYIVATIKDITRSKHMEADLKKTKEFLEKIIEGSGHAIVVADMKGVVLLMNESARRLFGYTDRVAVGKSIAEYHYTPGGARSVMKKLRSPDYGGVGRMEATEMMVINSSGEEIPVEVTASIIYERGREIASMAIFQDLRPKIEAEKRLEKTKMQLVQSDKLASIGRLAAGVAHEINNPLGGIIMYSHLSMEELPEESPLYKNLQKVTSQAERCKRIVKGLLDFSRQREPEIESVNLNDLLRDIFALLETQSIFQNIKIEKKLETLLPPILGDRSQLQQVFINLVLNAAEAMENGGKLTVESSLEDGTVKVRFMDTGCGIVPDDMKKIFEPFFTTKSDRDGTGLGLAVSHGIIAKHKGSISCKSRFNHGTTFTVRLPVTDT